MRVSGKALGGGPRPHPTPHSSIPGYSFKLESANIERMYLHTSSAAPYTHINHPDDLNLAKCLRTGLPCEVNLAPSFSTYTIFKWVPSPAAVRPSFLLSFSCPSAFALCGCSCLPSPPPPPRLARPRPRPRPRHHDHALLALALAITTTLCSPSPQSSPHYLSRYNRVHDGSTLQFGDPFRLYHSQAESFVRASCDPDKGKSKGGSRLDQVRLRRGDGPTHVPYLRRLVDEGSDPDPTNPEHQSAKGVWVVEAMERSEVNWAGGGLLRSTARQGGGGWRRKLGRT